jgi:hypothetical protein
MQALPNYRLACRSLDIFGRLGICNQISQTNRSNVSVDQGVDESVAETGTKSSQETREFFVFRLIVILRPMQRRAKLLLQRFADGREINIGREDPARFISQQNYARGGPVIFLDLQGNVCSSDVPGRVWFVPPRSFRSRR